MRAWLVVAVSVCFSGCQHVLRVGLNPDAERIAKACSEKLNKHAGGGRCAAIFQKTDCHNAWSALPEVPSEEQLSATAQICARDYCPLSTHHSVAACENPKAPLTGRTMRDMFSFAISRELGLSNLSPWVSLLKTLEPVPPDAGPHVEMTPELLEGAHQTMDALHTGLVAVRPEVKQCADSVWGALPIEDSKQLHLALMAELRIAPTGVVESVEIVSATERLPKLEVCVVNAFRKHTFPEFPGPKPTKLSWTQRFAPGP